MRRDRPRYQVVLQLMPGAEPWLRVEAEGREVARLPAACSLLELWEILSGGRRHDTPGGTVMVRVPLDQVLAGAPTVGAYRRQRRGVRD